MLPLDWTTFKTSVISQGLAYKYYTVGDSYYIFAYDGNLEVICVIPISSPANSDQTDFETSYKSTSFATLGQFDTDGAGVVRVKAAKKGWSFWAIPIELTTSLLSNNLYCKDSAGVDIPGISYKIYDAGGLEITVPGIANINLTTCIKTVIDFEPPFDYEIIGGALRTNTNSASDIRMWIVGAPDIPAIYGGSKEFASGINLKFLAPDSSFEIDGRVTKFLTYSAVTHSNKMRIIFKHPAGTQLNMQIIIHIYRA